MVGVLIGVLGGAAALLLLGVRRRDRKGDVSISLLGGGNYMAAWYLPVDGGVAL